MTTPIPIPNFPTPFPTPPPLDVTPLEAVNLVWNIEESWGPALSAAQMVFYLQFLDYIIYFLLITGAVAIALRLFLGGTNYNRSQTIIEQRFSDAAGRLPDDSRTEQRLQEIYDRIDRAERRNRRRFRQQSLFSQVRSYTSSWFSEDD